MNCAKLDHERVIKTAGKRRLESESKIIKKFCSEDWLTCCKPSKWHEVPEKRQSNYSQEGLKIPATGPFPTMEPSVKVEQNPE